MHFTITKKANLKCNQLYLLRCILLDSVIFLTKYVVVVSNTLALITLHSFVKVWESRSIVVLAYPLIYLTMRCLYRIHDQVNMNMKQQVQHVHDGCAIALLVLSYCHKLLSVNNSHTVMAVILIIVLTTSTVNKVHCHIPLQIQITLLSLLL